MPVIFFEQSGTFKPSDYGLAPGSQIDIICVGGGGSKGGAAGQGGARDTKSGGGGAGFGYGAGGGGGAYWDSYRTNGGSGGGSFYPGENGTMTEPGLPNGGIKDEAGGAGGPGTGVVVVVWD